MFVGDEELHSMSLLIASTMHESYMQQSKDDWFRKTWIGGAGDAVSAEISLHPY